jgi:carbon storage regulator CsrA
MAVQKGSCVMLVLSRKLNERIVLPALKTVIQVLDIKRGVVRLGVEAPRHLTVLREELAERRADWPPAQTHPELSDLQNEADEHARGGAAPGDPASDPFAGSPLAKQLCERLKATAVTLGALRLQLDAGLTDAARRALTQVHEEFQVLCYGVVGELESHAAIRQPQARKPQKALIVEDDCNQCQLLAGLLRQSGLCVDTAGDGADALDYLRSHGKPDVVLLDMGLPRVDGPTVVREIRSNPDFAGLKIFGVTAYSPTDFHLEQGPRGIDRWFQKPLDPCVLLQDLVAVTGR